MTYQARLAEAMEARGVTRAALAAAARVKYQAIAQVLNGNSKMLYADSHSLACAFLRVDPVWLATGEGQMDAPLIRANSEVLSLVNLIGTLSAEMRERAIGYIDALRRDNETRAA